MRLYIVRDKSNSFALVVKAVSPEEAISKVQKWIKETNRNGECWHSKNIKWIAELCDNEEVIK